MSVMARSGIRTQISSTPSVRLVGGSGLLPRTGVVLVGTPHTLPGLAAQVKGLEGAPIINGSIIVGSGGSAPATTPPALGTIDDLPLLAARFGLRCAVVCLPRSMDAQRAEVTRAVEAAGVEARWVPALEDALRVLPAQAPTTSESGKDDPVPGDCIAKAAPVIDLAALIGRQPYRMDREAVALVLRGKRVLITGAGGSIGSELARVAAAFEPSQLILMERSENALFEIDRQLSRKFPGLQRRAVLHDVADAPGTLRLCRSLMPEVVFHAAAHKHVPLMEDHPAHAVTNNLFGTKSIADAAVAVGADRFVMISSDKAVNPTSVMGATKRLAELYIRGLGEHSGRTRLSMVRFGNVLGSAASVLTIWSQQIAEGGPVTITDPRMTRYFMTIPEAATLVVQSTTLRPAAAPGTPACEGHEAVGVFVLDMGQPIRIVELAERFIRAHGLNPRLARPGEGLRDAGHAGGTFLDVVTTGARPGEKLHEELAYNAELLLPTAHPGIRAWGGPGFGDVEASRVAAMVSQLDSARKTDDPGAVLTAIRRFVPEMVPAADSKTVPQKQKLPIFSDSAAPADHPNAG